MTLTIMGYEIINLQYSTYNIAFLRHQTYLKTNKEKFYINIVVLPGATATPS